MSAMSYQRQGHNASKSPILNYPILWFRKYLIQKNQRAVKEWPEAFFDKTTALDVTII